jgi:hypothetical protein
MFLPKVDPNENLQNAKTNSKVYIYPPCSSFQVSISGFVNSLAEEKKNKKYNTKFLNLLHKIPQNVVFYSS